MDLIFRDSFDDYLGERVEARVGNVTFGGILNKDKYGHYVDLGMRLVTTGGKREVHYIGEEDEVFLKT